jgi:single-strand DNA-binding protein
MSVNLAILVGHLGRDGDFFAPKAEGGQPALKFSLATTERRANGDDVTTWHNVVAFGKVAEWNSGLKKGDQVFLEGAISHRDYTDREGTKKTWHEIVARRIQLVRARNAGPPSQGEKGNDNLPF